MQPQLTAALAHAVIKVLQHAVLYILCSVTLLSLLHVNDTLEETTFPLIKFYSSLKNR